MSLDYMQSLSVICVWSEQNRFLPMNVATLLAPILSTNGGARISICNKLCNEQYKPSEQAPPARFPSILTFPSDENLCGWLV